MRRLLFICGILLLLSGCSDYGNPVTTSAPKIPQQVQEIFNANCLGCHGASGSGNLNLSEAVSYANLVDMDASGYDGKRIAAGLPNESILWHKISGTGLFGPRMPLGDSLSVAEVATIENWIIEDAESR